VKVAHATLGATPDRNDDRVFITDNAVIVMDGASAFLPTAIDTGTYVDTLGATIVDGLQDQAADLRTIVANAIRTTTTKLDLRTDGSSPSSTVSIVRVGPKLVDVFVLGDTPVILGFTDGTHQRITDDRLARLHFPARDAYRARLAADHGYDDEHRRLLAQLQQQQRRFRNTEGGYWIAEAEAKAAYRALIDRYELAHVSWAILLTDGVEHPLVSQREACWPEIAVATTIDLAKLLNHCQAWESACAPARAKRHDDKTIASLLAHVS
jgi:hypothetical protein